MDVRRATASEAAIVARLNRHVQQLHADAAPRLFKQPGEGIDAQVFAELIARPDTHVLIGYADGEPVGHIVTQVVHPPEHPLRHALDLVYVQQIAADPARSRSTPRAVAAATARGRRGRRPPW